MASESLLIQVAVKDDLSAALQRLDRAAQGFGDKIEKALSVTPKTGFEDISRKVAALSTPAQKTAQALGDVDRAAARAAGGVSRLGSEITSRLGPAGGIANTLASEIVSLSGGLDELAAGAGLSSKALLGIGAAATGIAAVGAGLYQAAQAASTLEKALNPAIAALAATPAEIEAIKSATRGLSSATGADAKDVASAYSALASSGIRDLDSLRHIISAASDASRLGLGSVTENAERLKAVLGTFGLPAAQSSEVLALLNADALDGGTRFGEYADSLVRVGRIARELQVEIRPLSALLKSVTAQELGGPQAAVGLSSALSKIINPADRVHKTLVAMGQDLSVAHIRAVGLLGVFAEIDTLTRDRPDVRADFAGDAKSSAAVFTAMRAAADAAAISVGTANDQLRRIGDSTASVATSSETLGRAWTILGNKAEELGSKILDGYVGALLKAGEVAAFIQKSKGAIGTTIADPSPSSALEGITDLINRLAGKSVSVPVTVVPEIEFGDVEGDVEKALELAVEAATTVPFQVPIDPHFERDPLQDAIRDALEGMPPIEIPFAPPEKLRKAIDLLANTEIALKLRPTALDDEKLAAAARLAVDEITAATNATAQAEDLVASLRLRSLDGLERQKAESENLLRVTERHIAALEKRLGVDDKEIAKARELLGILKGQNAEKVAESSSKETSDLTARVLDLRSRSVEKARELALASGDVATADRLAVDAVRARAAAAFSAADREIAALREQYKGRADLLPLLEEAGALIRRNAEAEAAGAEAARQRSLAERSRNTQDALGDARGALLTGFDAELDAIERNRQAKIRSAQDAARSGQIEAGALGELISLYNRAAEADRARAGRENELRQLETMAGLIGEVEDSYYAQARAIDVARDAERARLQDTLAGLNVQDDQLEASLALFDRLSEKSQIDAAVRFAQVPATAIAETELYANAFRNARREAERLGLAGVEAAEHIQQAMLEARSGTEALTAGFQGGFEDFRRSVFDDFSFGAEAARNQAQTFKDSWVDALGAIGQEGSDVDDVLRDFAIANLQQLQKNAAEFAFNQIGQAILGPPEARKEGEAPGLVDSILGRGGAQDPLALSAGKLDTSAVNLDTAALALSNAASALTGGFVPPGGGVVPVGQEPLPIGIGPAQAGPGIAPVDQNVLTFQLAVDRFVAGVAAFPGATGVDFLPSGAPQGPPLSDFLPAGAPSDAPVDQFADASEDLVAASGVVEDSLLAGSQGAASALVAGGDQAAASFLAGIAGSLGNALSGGITSGIGGFLGFKEGGILPGPTRKLHPLANRLGGRYRQRTLIEVAEVPGLEEAVIPLKGGAVPVEVKRAGPQNLSEDRRAELAAQRSTDLALRSAQERRRGAGRAARAGRGEGQGRGARGPVSVSLNVSLPAINISVGGGSGGTSDRDLERRLLALTPQLRRDFASALASGLDRKLIEAVREAAQGR